MSKIQFLFLSTLLCFALACNSNEAKQKTKIYKPEPTPKMLVGADDHKAYMPILKDKKIGMVVNQTSMKGETHLVDYFQKEKLKVQAIFSPEHGFRGKADAGGQIKDGIDEKSGLPVYSLYGKSKKPSAEQMKSIDMMIFDIQDVGARFYTYISTLHYVMEACAEAKIPLMVMDRPNPNGHYVDGPIMEKEFSSFVGMHPVPIVHGMTIGEYAQMINGEGWLTNGIKCTLIVMKCQNYNHEEDYILPIKPSPNLPNNIAINLYPSFCLFEGTSVSVGRGTDKQFQIIGHPKFDSTYYNYTFIPVPKEGASSPKHQGKACYGRDYSTWDLYQLQERRTLFLTPLLKAYENFENKDEFFNNFFNKLAGNSSLQEMIKNGNSEYEIKKSWKPGLVKFLEMRKKYLLYFSNF